MRLRCFCLPPMRSFGKESSGISTAAAFDFPAIRLSGIHPELYSIYQAAKTISVGGDNIVIEDLAFSELVSDRAFRLILGALLLCRYGEVVLNLERKTEEIT